MISSAIPLPDFVMQSNQSVSITSPVEGEVLSGVVNIIGTTELAGFSQAELAFSSAIGSIETWFPIGNSTVSVKNDQIITWDTTIITDGEYRLRLRVYTEDNSISEFLISNLSIKNFIPPNAPSQTSTFVFQVPTATILSAMETPAINPTGLPENPLALSTTDLAKSLIYGIFTILGLIVISSFYTRRQRK